MPGGDRRLLTRLRRDHAAARRRVSLLGVARTVAGAVLLLCVFALIVGAPYQVPTPVRIGALAVLGCGLLAALWFWLLRPLRGLGDRAASARRIDRALGLRNGLVVVEERERTGRRGPDPDLDAALHRRLVEGLASRYEHSPDPRRLGLPAGFRPYGLVLLALAAAGAFWFAAPDAGRLGLARLSSPGTDLVRPLSYTLTLDPWKREVVAGTDVNLVAVGDGRGPADAVCEVRTVHGGWRTLKHETVRDGDRITYQAGMRGLNEDVVFRFRRGRIETPEAAIHVLHAPMPTDFVTTVEPPAYTGMLASRFDPTPSMIEAPAGSRLVWEGRISHPVVVASLIQEDGDTISLACDGDVVRAERVLEESLHAELMLQDAKGLVGGGGVRYEVRLIPDTPPVVSLARPEDGDRLPPDGRVQLSLAAEDDYGLHRPELQIRRESQWGAFADSNWTTLRIPARGGERSVDIVDGSVRLENLDAEGTRDGLRYVALLDLDLGAVDLLPGDALDVRARVRDNREPGPKAWGRSGTLRFTVPSAEDLMVEQVATAEERMSSLDEVRQRGEAIAEELARLERELKKNPETDFARKQELEDALAQQNRLQDELRDTAEELRRDMERTAERTMASPELMEKMERVAELLEEVQDEEMRRLQEQLREAMDELSPEDVRRAMEEVAERQEEFLERLDRAIALLEDLRKEQELAAMAAQVEEMMRTQQELSEAAADSSAAAGDENPGENAEAEDERLADRQEALADELAALEETLRQKAEELSAEDADERSAAAEAMREALEKALEELSESGAEESMREASENLRDTENSEGDPGEAQHESMRKLASLYYVLMQGQQSMQAAMEQFVAEALQHLAHELLTLSDRQERLAGRIPTDLQNVHTVELGREEMRVLRAAVTMRDHLTEILRQSPSLSAKLLNSLDEVIEGLDATVTQIHDGWGRSAEGSARRSLGDLNQLVISLLTSPQMSGSGSGSCPMPSLGQQLEQMAREQAGLNGLTQQMKPGGGQRGLSQETRAQMERLQSEQQGLAGRMQETAEQERNSPEAERLLGDLEELARDMERVADQLSTGTVDEDVLRRQERILSRLLDARNSVRRRDYERRRESTTGEDLYRRQAGDALEDRDADEREALSVRRRQMEHVPPDYRDLVRRYFQSLPRNGAPSAGGSR